MFDRIIFHQVYYGQHCTIQFNQHSTFNDEISVDGYSFAYEFDEDEIETIAKLLDAFYGVIKDKLCTIEQTNKLEQYNILQDALKTIIKE